jgi:hypothetical protein
MSTLPDEGWLSRSNAETLYHLERQGRSSSGVVPFLGAGISTAFGLKDWKGLLSSASPPHLAPAVKALLDEGKYEEAAETLLREFGADGFQNMVAALAGDSNIERFDFRTGIVSLLPLLATGPVVTTNFDRVLERAFEANGTPFESIISGPRPDLIVDALHGNRRVLVKLHGDWQDRVGRTFTQSDYDANYGESQPEKKRELLDAAERLIFSCRSLLFLGASLGPDRTVKLLQQIHSQYAGIRHFAIMKVPTTQGKLNAKEQQLRKCGVLPLWYHAETRDEHIAEVERIVADILERISVQSISGPAAEAEPPPTITAVVKQPTVTARLGLDSHFERIIRLIEDGRITFFGSSDFRVGEGKCTNVHKTPPKTRKISPFSSPGRGKVLVLHSERKWPSSDAPGCGSHKRLF